MEVAALDFGCGPGVTNGFKNTFLTVTNDKTWGWEPTE